MDITEACMTLRACEAAFGEGREPKVMPFELELAVHAIKRFLEAERPDACPIRELEIDEQLLFTRVGVHYVMPFVRDVERRLQARHATSP